MKNDRLRIQVDEPYLIAIGRAVFCFAGLEWNAVWCCERLQPKYINKIGRKNSGGIARDLIAMTRRIGDSKLRGEIEALADEFERLVAIRNALIHGKPGTAENGDQRLFRDRTEWTIDRANDAADEFTACSIRLNALLYDSLKSP